ncbi:DNA polymerase delta catalytic subunit [Micractinium conductrix]|uniref:DNA polymerase n=1 Tax=Micractinium conductrix TaxID=554055 RepID=A0A2P6VB32_9CHLO|nr:DNA polymerase delta catalytic subunit [Micractinium conductrix]|eukprot:PSC71316.1 DNA polymerase delta catalytic subunit [Micractinium conductrix]
MNSAAGAKRPAPESGGQYMPRKRPAAEDDDIMEEDFELEPPEDEFEDGADIEVDEGQLGEAGKNWPRPPAPALDPKKDSLVFQQLEVDYSFAPPSAQHYPAGRDLKEVPVLRMFGVTEGGSSVAAFVHGFEPYFYAEAPSQTFTPDDCQALAGELNMLLAGRDKSKNPRQCLRVELTRKQTVMYYQPLKDRLFLRIVLAKPDLVAPCRGYFEQGISMRWLGGQQLRSVTYESNVLYALRFMIDCKVVGGNWVELPAGKYSLVAPHQHQSHCQLEAHLHYSSLVSHEPQGQWAKMAPFRILSVDIECQGRKGHFPEPEKDPVIQIASLVTEFGKTTPTVRNIMTLKSCAPISGAEVMSFEDEKQLLLRWRDLVLETDPDVIIGYNIINFDLPYLLNRATTLQIPQFWTWGRLRNRRCKMKDARFSSKAYGTHDFKEITIEGRVQFDLLQAIQRDHKLSAYSLNAVSAHFLGEQKEDVHHSDISKLQDGNAESRRRLAIYCLKDAYLPQRLVDNLMYMYNYVEMARVTGVPMSYLLSRGQSIKVFSQILRKALTKNLVVPNMKKGGDPNEGVAYEGATVLEPKAGYYDKPVATLDFASLYPSIMMAHNLCYTTLLPKGRENAVPKEHVTVSPNGDHFVKPSMAKGLLPEILDELLTARKTARKEMATVSDPFLKAVYNGRQVALKVSANSVYGFTGATVGALPCLEISSSVTSFGREMIMETRRRVQEKYCKANGYSHNADVIYGDTDSVMINFGVEDNATAMQLGLEAAEEVSKAFIKPIKLEFEKIYNPYLLISKKRYAGLLWTKPDKWDKIDTKGIETVRRDNCLLVRNVVTTCLEKILVQRNPQDACEYVKGIIADLLMNKLDLSLLVISKGLTQDADEYENKTAHVELAKKMKKRDLATAPSVGDRVPYVIIKAAKGAKAYEKAEDPLYALKNNLPIDCQHYLEHHLEKPLMRLFEPIMKNPKELLTGAHTRSIMVATPSAASGGIMKFAQKRLTCLGCKAPLGKGEQTVCKHCKAKEGEIYTRTVTGVNDLEAQFSALWTQCQRCQGSLHQDVLCRSRDCPIFYRRMKVQKELGEAQTTLQRFDEW